MDFLYPRVRWSAVRGGLAFSLVVAGLAGLARAAEVVMPVAVAANRVTGRVTLPEGTTSLTLQRAAAGGRWLKVRTIAAAPGAMTLRLPPAGRNTKFRVTVNVRDPEQTRFPRVFYQGKRAFGPSRVVSGGLRVPYLEMAYANVVSVMPRVDDAAQPEAPAEADIWKISGTTAYFFNQLRGLQVIDLARPEEPRLIASLRLPAAGQDLYLLPSAEGFQDLLLVETVLDAGGAQTTRLQSVRVEDGAIRTLQTVDVPGRPVDSRLVGRRLFLCLDDNADGVKLTEWFWPADGEAAPQSGAEISLVGRFATLAAGADWLAVAMTPPGAWDRSAVSAYRLEESGLTALTAAPVAVRGWLNDAYKIQWRDGVLTTIAQQWGSGGLATWLENFSAGGAEDDGAPLGQLELARGESLHATRFAGDKAYIVTFFQKDPLFVIDLRDPAAPVVAGQLDVPGWSTHLEPLGDMLFSVGWDEGAVTASLFDVSDPAAPGLLRRLALTEGSGYSEANWDPQALKLIPGAGLALVPVNGYAWGGESREQGVRLIDVDLSARDLRLRGIIPGRFEARRAALVEDAVVTLSQRTIATADIADRDAPATLADILLAWPVNHALPVGDKLIAVETGGAWDQGYPAARTSTLAEPDALLAELDLPLGYVHDTALRDGRFYVLRETSALADDGFFLRHWAVPVGRLNLDVYDAADPADLKLLGTTEWDASASGASRVGRLLWPRATRPAVVLEASSWGWYGGPIFIADPVVPFFARSTGGRSSDAGRLAASVSVSVVDVLPPIWDRGWFKPDDKPGLLVFDITDPSAPGAAQWLPLATEAVNASEVKAAGDGLVVVGLDRWSLVNNSAKGAASEGLHHALCVVSVPESGPAKAGAPVDLPGSLIAVPEVSRAGFLFFTRTDGVNDAGPALQACVYDGLDAFQVAETTVAAAGASAAADRSLWYATGSGVAGLRVDDDGRFEALPPLRFGWNPAALEVAGGRLLGADWKRLFEAPTTGTGATREWTLPTGFALDRVNPTAAGGWVVPCGDYGVEVLPPASK